MDASAVEVFKTGYEGGEALELVAQRSCGGCILEAVRWDGALSTLVQWKVLLPKAMELEPDNLEDPFQPKLFNDSVISRRAEHRKGEVQC